MTNLEHCFLAKPRCEFVGESLTDIYPGFTIIRQADGQVVSVHCGFEHPDRKRTITPENPSCPFGYGNVCPYLELPDAYFEALREAEAEEREIQAANYGF